MTIKIDLNNLTQKHLDECKPHVGNRCTYSAPCIIGTLIPVNERGACDAHSSSSIGTLVTYDVLKVPAEQLDDARKLQSAFDCDNWDLVTQIASKYIDPERKF